MANIKIAIKMLQKQSRKEQWKLTENNTLLQHIDSSYPCNFRFDNIFGTECRNCDVYAKIVEPIVKICLDGHNGTILTYGQTSSGKSRLTIGTDDDPGIQLMAIEQIFKRDDVSTDLEFKYRVSYIEIFKEKVYDLLNPRKKVTVHSNSQFDVKLSNKEVTVDSSEKAIDILFDYSHNRKLSSKDGNRFSSLSHTLFRITIEATNKVDNTHQSSYLQFVQVAGSELVSEARTLDSQLTDADRTNKSLLWLNYVVDKLSEAKVNVDFGYSRLTQLIQESLGGNCNTAVVCNIRTDVVDKTISTLKFATQVQKVVNDLPIEPISLYTDEEFMIIQNDLSSLECSFLAEGLINAPDIMDSDNLLRKFDDGRKRELDDCVQTNTSKRRKTFPELFPSPPSAASSSLSTECCSFSDSSTTTTDSTNLDHQEIIKLKMINFRLANELEEVKAAHQNEKRELTEQLNATISSLRESELLQIQEKALSHRIQRELEQKNREIEIHKNEIHRMEANNSNSEDKTHVEQLLLKLGEMHDLMHTSNQTNIELIRKQNEMLRRLEQENHQLKQEVGVKNNYLAPPPGYVETEIEQKIQRLESEMARNIDSLKRDLGSDRVSTNHIDRLKTSSMESDKFKESKSQRIKECTVSHKMSVLNKFVGCIIGKCGQMLRYIESNTGAKIKISTFNSEEPMAERQITIDGTSESVTLAVNLIKKQIEDFKNKKGKQW